MKGKRVIRGMVIAGILSGVLCAQAQAREVSAVAPDQLLKYELTLEGTLQENERFIMTRDAVLVEDGENYAFVSTKGDKLVNGISDVEYLGGNLYRVRQPLEEENVNKTGLVTGDGEILIPCEAASIVRPNNREDGIRFLEVIYTTGVTDNEEDCIIYFTESMFSISVGEEDVMYTGYARIFDVERGQFVEGVEFDQTSRYGFFDLGDSFVIEHGNMTTMYDADGNQLWETNGSAGDATWQALSVYANGKYYIVDSTGKDVYASDDSLDACCGPLDYFTVWDGEDEKHYHIIDMEGNRILEDAYGIVYGSNSSCNDFSVKLSGDDEEMAAVDREGKIIAEHVDININILGGYNYITFEDKESVMLVTPKAVYGDLQEGRNDYLLFGRNDHPIIINSGEEIESIGEDADGEALMPGLFSVSEESSSGKYYGVYDLFTGDQLLETQYNKIEKAGEYILAATTDSSGIYTWEIYHVALVPADGE